MANTRTTAKGAMKSAKKPARVNKANRAKPTQGSKKRAPPDSDVDENDEAQPPKRINTGARDRGGNSNTLAPRTNRDDSMLQQNADIDAIMQRLAEMEG
jgi:hypothetical protein